LKNGNSFHGDRALKIKNHRTTECEPSTKNNVERYIDGSDQNREKIFLFLDFRAFCEPNIVFFVANHKILLSIFFVCDEYPMYATQKHCEQALMTKGEK